MQDFYQEWLVAKRRAKKLTPRQVLKALESSRNRDEAANRLRIFRTDLKRWEKTNGRLPFCMPMNRSEMAVYRLLIRKFGKKHVRRQGILYGYDMICNGLGIEIKASNPLGPAKRPFWVYTIARQGKLREKHVNFYILRAEKVPGIAGPIHLILKAPLGVKSIHLTMRKLLTKYGNTIDRFDLLAKPLPAAGEQR